MGPCRTANVSTLVVQGSRGGGLDMSNKRLHGMCQARTSALIVNLNIWCFNLLSWKLHSGCARDALGIFHFFDYFASTVSNLALTYIPTGNIITSIQVEASQIAISFVIDERIRAANNRQLIKAGSESFLAGHCEICALQLCSVWRWCNLFPLHPGHSP